MATRIRLRRVGRKKQPSFRIVVAGSMHSRSGRVSETIGKYNPRTEPTFIEIDEKRAIYWMGQGAQLSEKVESLFRQTGIMKKVAEGVEGEGVVTIGSLAGKTVRPPKPSEKKAKEKAETEAEAAVATATEEAPAAEAATEEAPAAEAAAEEAPVAEAAATEEAAPAEDAAVPVEDAAVPAEDAAVPIEDAAVPVEDEAEASEEKQDAE